MQRRIKVAADDLEKVIGLLGNALDVLEEVGEAVRRQNGESIGPAMVRTTTAEGARWVLNDTRLHAAYERLFRVAYPDIAAEMDAEMQAPPPKPTARAT